MKRKWMISSIIIVIVLLTGIFIYYNSTNKQVNICKPVESTEQLYLTKINDTFEFVNKENQVRMKLNYDYVTPFNDEGIAIVHKDSKADLMDKSCHLLTHFSYKSIFQLEDLPGYYFAKKQSNMYVINKNNEVIYTWNNYNQMNFVDKGTYEVRVDEDGIHPKFGLYEYQDGTFNELLRPEYTKANFIWKDYQGDLIGTYILDHKAGFVKRDGQKIEFDGIFSYDRLFQYGVSFIMKDSKWALINNNGDLLTSYEFDQVKPFFSFEEAAVMKNNRWALMRIDGTLLTDFIYSDIIIGENGYIALKKYNLWAYFDSNLNQLTDYIYTIAQGFNEHVAIVQREGKYTLIDETGHELFTPTYEYINDFNNGLALVRKNSKLGYIDLKGHEVIESKYESLLSEIDGNRISAKLYNKWGVIDQDGNKIVDFLYDDLKPLSEHYLAASQKINADTKWGVINTRTGELVVNTIYQNINFYIGNGKFNVTYQDDPLRSEVDLGDKHDYDLIPYYVDGKQMIYQKDDKVGLIDTNGNKVTEPIFEQIYSVQEDGVMLNKDGKIGILTFNGTELIPFNYDAITQLYGYEGVYAAVKENNKWGLINNKGEIILTPQYESIAFPFDPQYKINAYVIFDGLLPVQKDGKWGLLSLKNNNQLIINYQFDQFEVDYDKDYIIVKLNNKYGLYDKEGNEILKPLYDEIIL